MNSKKNYVEILGSITGIISISGIAIFIIASVLALLHKSNQTSEAIGIIGAVMFMLPFFSLQFMMPSGLLKKMKVDEIPVWGKVMFYALVFPFANMWMLSAFDAAFNFLPQYRLGDVGGNKELAELMYHEHLVQAWTIIASAYFGLIALGIIFKAIFKKWLEVTPA